MHVNYLLKDNMFEPGKKALCLTSCYSNHIMYRYSKSMYCEFEVHLIYETRHSLGLRCLECTASKNFGTSNTESIRSYFGSSFYLDSEMVQSQL